MQIMSAHVHHFVHPLDELRPDLPSWLTKWVMSLLSKSNHERPSVEQAIKQLP